MIDEILDGISYIFSFEWLGDIWDFMGGMFQNIGEFSIAGLFLGLVSAGTIFVLRDYMLNPFLQYMTPATAIFWGVATYAGCGVAGYLVGKRLFED